MGSDEQNDTAPEGRNINFAVANVSPLRGLWEIVDATHGSRRGLQIFRRSAAKTFVSLLTELGLVHGPGSYKHLAPPELTRFAVD